MARARPFDLWLVLHRYTGLAIMLFVGIAGLTGCILCFDRQIDEALNRDLFRTEATGRPVDALAAVARLQAARPDLQVTGFPLRVADGHTIPVAVGALPGQPALGYDTLFLRPADATVAGTRSAAPSWDRRGLVAGIASFHYTLLAGTFGRWLMGAMALAWFLSNLVGVYLTFPKKGPFWKQWKRMWKASPRSPLPRLLLDLHRASGLWLLPVVTVLAFTSVCLNFYSEAYEPAAVAIAPLKHDRFSQPAPFADGARPTLSYGDALRLAAAEARKRHLGWQPATMLYRPDWNFYGVTFTNDGELNYRALGPVYLYFDARSGALAHEVDPYRDSAGLVMIRILYPLHSGEIGGPLTVALIFLGGAATVLMAATGTYVWWRKRRTRLAGAAARQRAVARA